MDWATAVDEDIDDLHKIYFVEATCVGPKIRYRHPSETGLLPPQPYHANCYEA